MWKSIVFLIKAGVKGAKSIGKSIGTAVAKGATATKSVVKKAVAKTVSRAGKAFSRTARVSARAGRTASASSTALTTRAASQLAKREANSVFRTVATKTATGRSMSKRMLRFGLAWTPWVTYKIWDHQWSKSRWNPDKLDSVYAEVAAADSVEGVLKAFGHDAQGNASPDDMPIAPPAGDVLDMVELEEAGVSGFSVETVRERDRLDFEQRSRDVDALLNLFRHYLGLLPTSIAPHREMGTIQHHEDREIAATLLSLEAVLSAIFNLNDYGVGPEDVEVARSLGGALNSDLNNLGNPKVVRDFVVKTVDMEPEVTIDHEQANELIVADALFGYATANGLRSLH